MLNRILILIACLVFISVGAWAQDVETANCKFDVDFTKHENCVTISNLEGACDIELDYNDCLITTYHASANTFDKYNGTTNCYVLAPINKVVSDNVTIEK